MLNSQKGEWVKYLSQNVPKKSPTFGKILQQGKFYCMPCNEISVTEASGVKWQEIQYIIQIII